MPNCSARNLIIILIITQSAFCQIARDIAIKFLFLDANRDHLLSTSELNSQHNTQITPQQKQIYYDWRRYETYHYPKQLFHKSDTNQDEKLSFLELNQIVKTKLKRHAVSWPKSTPNVLNVLKTQDYLLICDKNKDQFLSLNQFLVCVQAFLIHQYKSYPYKIKSLLFPNRTIGYDIDQFRQLLPKSRQQQDAENQIIYLFNGFQWPQWKIQQDTDLLIGAYEGKFLQPTILYFYLDVNGDEVLDKAQAMKYFRKNGGQQAFELADFTEDQQLDQAEIISYFLFASCMEADCTNGANKYTYKNQKQEEETCKFTPDQNLMFNTKYQTQQAICQILGLLQQKIQAKTTVQKEKVQKSKLENYHNQVEL